MLSVAVVASVLGFVAAPYKPTCQEKADLSQMQGEWECSCRAGALDEPEQPLRILVTGATLSTWQGRHKACEWKLRLDASRSPRAFVACPVGDGEPEFGTYELGEGALHLIWTSHEGARATSLVLSRPVPPPAAMPCSMPSPGEARAASVRVPPPPMLR